MTPPSAPIDPDEVEAEYVFWSVDGERIPIPVEAATSGVPRLVTEPATGVGTDAATLVGSLGDGAVATVWFEWAEAGEEPPRSTPRQDAPGAGTFEATLEDLTPGTTFEYWATAEAGGTTLSGRVRTFTTGGGDA